MPKERQNLSSDVQLQLLLTPLPNKALKYFLPENKLRFVNKSSE